MFDTDLKQYVAIATTLLQKCDRCDHTYESNKVFQPGLVLVPARLHDNVDNSAYG